MHIQINMAFKKEKGREDSNFILWAEDMDKIATAFATLFVVLGSNLISLHKGQKDAPKPLGS